MAPPESAKGVAKRFICCSSSNKKRARPVTSPTELFNREKRRARICGHSCGRQIGDRCLRSTVLHGVSYLARELVRGKFPDQLGHSLSYCVLKRTPCHARLVNINTTATSEKFSKNAAILPENT